MILYALLFHFHRFDHSAEHGVKHQQRLVAYEHKVFTRPCHCHIELGIDDGAVLLKIVGSEEVKLITVLDSESVDDYVALAALKTLDGVDGDSVELADAVTVDGIAY